MNAEKPQRLRNAGYAMQFAMSLPSLQRVAREHGYALAVHGSMATDLDLIACPWTENAVDAETLIEALRDRVDGHIRDEREWRHNPAERPHGRLAWSIYFRDDFGGPYLDISVMPRIA